MALTGLFLIEIPRNVFFKKSENVYLQELKKNNFTISNPEIDTGDPTQFAKDLPREFHFFTGYKEEEKLTINKERYEVKTKSRVIEGLQKSLQTDYDKAQRNFKKLGERAKADSIIAKAALVFARKDLDDFLEYLQEHKPRVLIEQHEHPRQCFSQDS